MLTFLAGILMPFALLLAQETQIGGSAPDRAKERLQAIDRAKALLSEERKVPESKIGLESATAATWPDSSLGCPEKDHMYAQVVTRGWKVILKVGDQVHEVHVSGKRAVCCPPSRDPSKKRP